jgi:nitroreductase
MTRNTTTPIHPQFLGRMSPRAFKPEALSQAQVEQLADAARWAPSASNKQPWHFAYALRGDANWEAFSTIPNEFNRRWCLEAGALIVLLSDRQASPGKHSFDAG